MKKIKFTEKVRGRKNFVEKKENRNEKVTYKSDISKKKKLPFFLFRKLDLKEEALADYTESLRLDATDFVAHTNRANLLYNTERVR